MSVIFTEVFFVTLLAAGVRMAMPILLAAVGEVFAERSGVLNINLEGQMLIGRLRLVCRGASTPAAWPPRAFGGESWPDR